ncbi:unnamed protein product [Soboliphyme baturini]|uniref:Uncharacterized protein n=1 Tax=Soboliphyme baturini TaxID=241478 RepID=A0A183I957_9BILA|nr:unnamed protein product [Soboliphyme baturini]
MFQRVPDQRSSAVAVPQTVRETVTTFRCLTQDVAEAIEQPCNLYRCYPVISASSPTAKLPPLVSEDKCLGLSSPNC